mmetsp:Transcript_21129/g.68127  ORF Transcript_21129/g.68127 Transcript_21129/m.68127 type:complete len:276 (-) Transcript_21129:388-1215(-)
MAVMIDASALLPAVVGAVEECREAPGLRLPIVGPEREPLILGQQNAPQVFALREGVALQVEVRVKGARGRQHVHGDLTAVQFLEADPSRLGGLFLQLGLRSKALERELGHHVYLFFFCCVLFCEFGHGADAVGDEGLASFLCHAGDESEIVAFFEQRPRVAAPPAVSVQGSVTPGEGDRVVVVFLVFSQEAVPETSPARAEDFDVDDFVVGPRRDEAGLAGYSQAHAPREVRVGRHLVHVPDPRRRRELRVPDLVGVVVFTLDEEIRNTKNSVVL